MSDPIETCPRCGSDQIAGLVAAFWHPVDEDLNEVKITGETEMGPERHCGVCDLEFDYGDQPPWIESEPAKKPRKRKRS